MLNYFIFIVEGFFTTESRGTVPDKVRSLTSLPSVRSMKKTKNKKNIKRGEEAFYNETFESDSVTLCCPFLNFRTCFYV